MKIAVAGFLLESVSFLPGITGIDIFENRARRGARLIAELRGTNTGIGGFIDACEQEGVALVGLVNTDAGAAGRAADAAFDRYLDEIAAGVRTTEPDALLLHLHGALVTETRPEADLEFVRGLRERLGDDLPIGLALDLHGNVPPALAEEVAVICGYRESPHIDMNDTGQRTARLLLASLRDEIDPVMAIAKPGVVLPSIFTATALPPLRTIVDQAKALPVDNDGLLDVSVFCGFAYADVPQIGFSVVAIADGDPGLARRSAEQLALRIVEQQETLLHRELVFDPAAALARARELAQSGLRPVVLLEHADRCNDSTYLLRELLRDTGLRAAVPYLWDPRAAEAASAAGVGSRVEIDVGGHSSPRAGGPVQLSGVVRYADHLTYTGTGPMRRKQRIDLGLTALVDTGPAVVSLTSHSLSAIDEDCLLQFGLRADEFDVILLRSKTHFRAAYERIAAEILIVDTPDWGTADLASLPYGNVRAGVYPIT